MRLTRRQSRAFAATFAVAALVLAVVATLMITRGWANDDVQRQVQQQENERRETMPRLSD